MESFRTQNIYQASFLMCRGLRLVGKEKEGNKFSLIFEGTNVNQEAIKFYNGGAKIEAKAYSDAYRTLKDYVFER